MGACCLHETDAWKHNETLIQSWIEIRNRQMKGRSKIAKTVASLFLPGRIPVTS